MVRKYIMLFEDFSTDVKAQTEESSSNWTDIRDSIQMKLPFVIVVFKDEKSYKKALQSDLFPDYVKQTASMSVDGKLVDFPSLFMVAEDDVVFKNKIQNIFDSFNVRQLILGKRGEEYCDVHHKDGTSIEAGNEIVSSLSKDDMQNNDHFKIGSTYYRFIDFADR